MNGSMNEELDEQSAREKSESNKILVEWINGMTLQDTEWIIMNVQ